MRIEKEKCRVRIVCQDGSLLIGFIHVNPGERIIDFINDPKEDFVPVTDAEFKGIDEVHSFKLQTKLIKKGKTVILNKSAIKWIEEF